MLTIYFNRTLALGDFELGVLVRRSAWGGGYRTIKKSVRELESYMTQGSC